MNATARIGFALLVAAALLLNPIGACAGNMQTSTATAHPCCPDDPAPVLSKCAKFACACLNAKPAAVVVFPHSGQVPLTVAGEGNIVLLWQPSALGTLAFGQVKLVRDHRFLILHQILI